MREELEDVVGALDTVPELSALLENPEIESHVKARVLDEVLGGADELVRNFVRLAVEKGRAGEIREIAAEFETLVAEQERILDVDLTTAHELDDTEFGRIVGRIEQATAQALGEIRREVASLSLLAAEKITRKTLTTEDQARLIDEALAEIDFSQLEASRS